MRSHGSGRRTDEKGGHVVKLEDQDVVGATFILLVFNLEGGITWILLCKGSEAMESVLA